MKIGEHPLIAVSDVKYAAKANEQKTETSVL